MIERGASRSGDFRLLQFNSGDQRPLERIGTKASVGRPSDSDYLVKESARIKDVLCSSLGNRDAMWTWITQTPGIYVTAVLVDEQVYGASLGLNYEPDDVYLTHMTAIKPAYRGLGLGTLIRRLQTASKPRFVASLSAHYANISDDGKTAVDAQISMMRVGAQDRAHEMIRLLDLSESLMT